MKTPLRQLIIESAARHVGCAVEDMTGPTKNEDPTMARMICYHLLTDVMGMSMEQAGRYFGRCRGSVCVGKQRVVARMQRSEFFKRLVDAIRADATKIN